MANEFNPVDTAAQGYDLAPQNPQAVPAEVMTMDGGTDFIVDLTTARKSYCSMLANTDEQRAILFNATNSTPEKIADHVGEEITVKDVYVEAVQCINRETQEVRTCPRVVLISADGIGYQAVSVGIFGALKKLFAIFGTPDSWQNPRRIKIRQINLGTNRMLTFDVIA